MKKLKQLQISEDIWQQAKIHCAKNNLTLKEFVENLINYATKEKMS